MTHAEHRLPAAHDPVAVIARHLRDGDEVIRCAAARALGRLADRAAAAVLVEALLDADPDVRSDAMEALLACARPEDAGAIRRSLMGDPVKEVKVAAIEVLCRLDDQTSLPLLRALAKDRCEQHVAWEDEAGMWDDWLDVQVAAVTALGQMGASEAIDDLLQARSDEMGQELDDVVFAALARIPDGGIEALVGLLRDRSGRVRAQALRALAAARRDLLVPLRDLLLRDASPAVRRLAIASLDPDDMAVDDLVRADPDPGLRRDALQAFAGQRPDLAKAALGDRDEAVRIVALEAVLSGLSAQSRYDNDDLAANLQAWMRSGGPQLAATCARLLPRLIGDRAEPPLSAIATDRDRPQEVRVAALRALGACAAAETMETFRVAAIDPIRQVRLAALAALGDLSKAPQGRCRSSACTLLVEAIEGRLLKLAAVPASDRPNPAQDAGASKVEDASAGRIAISRDGEILSADALSQSKPEGAPSHGNVILGHFPRSTLDAIQSDGSLTRADADVSAADKPLDPASKARRGRRRRVAVDGPDDVAGDVPLTALRVAVDCPGMAVEQALLHAFAAPDRRCRAVAAEAIARRAEVMSLSPDLLAHLTAALGDLDPVLRGHAARAIARRAPDAAACLAPLLDDPDAIIRAIALAAAGTPAQVRAGLGDVSPLVRKAALGAVLDSGDLAGLEAGLTIALAGGWIDSLAEACGHSPAARHCLLSVLGIEETARRQAQVALEALALAPGPGPVREKAA